MRTHKITKWDEGQVLIKASDCLFECAAELKETQPEFAKMLREMGLTVGDKFNAFGSHDFGLRCHGFPEQVTDPCEGDSKGE